MGRIVTRILCIAFLTLVTAACSGKDGGAPPTGTNAPPERTATAAASATRQAGRRGGTLTVAMARDVANLDPARGNDVYSAVVLDQVVEPLFEFDRQGNIVGRLVERTENPEPNVYRLTLRDGIRFQDGTPLDAQAVKFNLERYINDPRSLRRQEMKDVTAIDAPDARTVVVTLAGPSAPFLSKLTGGAGSILSPTALDTLGDGVQFDLTGAGSGPFKFVEWRKDGQAVVERNERYWRRDSNGESLPYLDRIVFKPIPEETARLTAVRTGEVDVLLGAAGQRDMAELRGRTDLTVKEMPGLGWTFIALNTEKEPFNDPAVRRAFSLALDRQALAQSMTAGAGRAQDTPVPDIFPWAAVQGDHPYLKRDVAAARNELAAAGKGDGVAFTVQVSAASPALQAQAELIRAQAAEAGLRLEVQPAELSAVVQNANRGEYQAAIITWGGGLDPDDNLTPLFSTRAPFNFARYTNPTLDALLDEARTTADQGRRGALYRHAQAILFQDQPFVIYQQALQVSIVRSGVQNYPETYNGYWGARDFARMWKTR